MLHKCEATSGWSSKGGGCLACVLLKEKGAAVVEKERAGKRKARAVLRAQNNWEGATRAGGGWSLGFVWPACAPVPGPSQVCRARRHADPTANPPLRSRNSIRPTTTLDAFVVVAVHNSELKMILSASILLPLQSTFVPNALRVLWDHTPDKTLGRMH